MTLPDSERRTGEDAPDGWGAALAVGLAAVGIALAVFGERTGRPLWQHRVGPLVTLAGGAVWVWRRGWRRRHR